MRKISAKAAEIYFTCNPRTWNKFGETKKFDQKQCGTYV